MKKADIILLAIITLMFGTVVMETDIYVPAFPAMKTFFGLSDQQIQTVLSYNFIGICLGSLLFGPLSDSFGRNTVLKIGLSLFSISSWGCVFFSDFNWFMVSRVIQGFGAAAPMVACFAIILDKYETSKVAQLCSVLNLFIAGAMAGSPILGSILILYFDWRSNFLVIAILATLSFFASIFLVKETLEPKNRLQFNIPHILLSYKKLLSSLPYMGGTFLSYLAIGGIIMFVANMSLIFIEHLGVSQESYGFYQATIMGTFALISAVSTWMIGKYGRHTTKYVGLVFMVLGTMALYWVAVLNLNPFMICAAMAIFTAGATLACVIYGVEAVSVFPNMKGVAAGLSNALRHIIVAGTVGISALNFDGTITPVMWVTVIACVLILFFAWILRHQKNVATSAPEAPLV